MYRILNFSKSIINMVSLLVLSNFFFYLMKCSETYVRSNFKL